MLLSVSVQAQQKPAEPAAEKAATQSRATTSSAAANYFPNLILYTQDNKPVHFYDDMLKGRVVLINFFFTSCTGVCPAMTANLAKVQTAMGDHVGKDVTMISISVDPETDKPQTVKKYAERFKAKPGWYFLTGDKKNVDWVLYKLGGYVTEKNDHSSILIIGNEATGEWRKMHVLAKPSEIAETVAKLLNSPKEYESTPPPKD
jgi:protein SCO1/2